MMTQSMRITLLSVAILTMSPTAQADDISTLKQQVSALQQSLRVIQQTGIDKGVKVAESLGTVDQLRHDFQTLQGSFDTVNFKLQGIQDALNRYQQDTDSRLRGMEERLEIYDKQVTSAVSQVAPGAAEEGTLYQKALSQTKDGNYLQAIGSFQTFQQKFPKSSLAGSSQYWVGECYYAMRDYQRAIREFQTTVDKYPKSDKAASAQLKQGLAFAELGMTSEAILFLQKLVKERPGAPEAQKAQDKIKQLEYQKSNAPKALAPGEIPLASGVAKPRTERLPLPLNTVTDKIHN